MHQKGTRGPCALINRAITAFRAVEFKTARNGKFGPKDAFHYMSDRTQFSTENTQYDAWVICELLHNCIATRIILCGGGPDNSGGG